MVQDELETKTGPITFHDKKVRMATNTLKLISRKARMGLGTNIRLN